MASGTLPIHVLVVDDDSSLRETIVRSLGNQPFVLFEAGSGNEALAFTERERIDIILSDVKMANGTGIELLEEIRRRHPSAPAVVLMTGFSDLSEQEMIAKGCRSVLKKPFKRSSLIETLTSIAEADFPERTVGEN